MGDREQTWYPVCVVAAVSHCFCLYLPVTLGQKGLVVGRRPETVSGQIYYWPSSLWGSHSCGGTDACYQGPRRIGQLIKAHD